MAVYRHYAAKLVFIILILAAVSLPVSAGLFKWSRLGRLLPQPGFEPQVSALAGHPTNASVLYAGTLRSTDNPNLVFKSSNAGISWQAASGNLPNSLPQNTGVNDLLIRPDSPSTLYVGLYEAGVWESTDGGQSWQDNVNGSIAANDTVRALALDPVQPRVVYAMTGTGVHRSENGGSWQSRSAGLPAPSATTFNDLTADPNHSGLWLFVATNPQGIYRTTNGGQSWEPVNDGLPAQALNVKGIAAGAAGGRILASIAGQGVWRSDDQGESWTRSDAGITYNTTLEGNAGVPVFSPTNADIAYVYNNDGVFVSYDGGETWSAFNDGFGGAETVTTIAIHPAAPATVYAGTSVSGVWSLTNVPGGRSFVPVVIR